MDINGEKNFEIVTVNERKLSYGEGVSLVRCVR